MKKSISPYSYTINVSSDDRGVFVPMLNLVSDPKLPKNLSLKRVYYVYNYGRGVIRGFHLHKKEWKFFTVASGAAKFVALNPKNPKVVFTFTSSSRSPQLIVIPPGYANGWVSLEDNTILLCGSTSSLQESLRDDARLDPLAWGNVWEVKPR